MVLDSNAVRQRCECFQTYVDADVVAIVRQLRWLVLDRETCIPASCLTANRQGLDFALQVAMLVDFDFARFRTVPIGVQFRIGFPITETFLTVCSFGPGGTR